MRRGPPPVNAISLSRRRRAAVGVAWQPPAGHRVTSASAAGVSDVLAINSADDERNPPELGIMERELQRVKHARLLLIPGSEETAGHGTTAQAKWWKQQLAEFLQGVPRKGQ